MGRSEEHTSELQSRETTSYAVLCLKKKKEHTSELQSHSDLVCRLLLEKQKYNQNTERTNKDQRNHQNE